MKNKLSQKQQKAKKEFLKIWHSECLPKYKVLENFNHGHIAKLPHLNNSKTLEVGAGLGAHLEYENRLDQKYYCLEIRKDFCAVLAKKKKGITIVQGDIQQRQNFADGFFDRIVAVHILEHIENLDMALKEISRLLGEHGTFDVVIPCEGGFAYSLARKLTAERIFKKRFKMDYGPIIENEHLHTAKELLNILEKYFEIDQLTFFPFFFIPSISFNLCVAMRLTKRL